MFSQTQLVGLRAEARASALEKLRASFQVGWRLPPFRPFHSPSLPNPLLLTRMVSLSPRSPWCPQTQDASNQADELQRETASPSLPFPLLSRSPLPLNPPLQNSRHQTCPQTPPSFRRRHTILFPPTLGRSPICRSPRFGGGGAAPQVLGRQDATHLSHRMRQGSNSLHASANGKPPPPPPSLPPEGMVTLCVPSVRCSDVFQALLPQGVDHASRPEGDDARLPLSGGKGRGGEGGGRLAYRELPQEAAD